MRLPRSFILAAAAAITSLGVLIFVDADAATPTTAPAPQPIDPQTLVGKPAPAFMLLDPGGKSHSLTDAKGHVVVVDFWATWCVNCPGEQKHLAELYQQHQADGLVVFAIDTDDDAGKIANYTSEHQMTLPVLIDPAPNAVGTAYDIDQMPETVVIGKDGIVTTVFTDFSETRTPPLLAQAIAAALAKP